MGGCDCVRVHVPRKRAVVDERRVQPLWRGVVLGDVRERANNSLERRVVLEDDAVAECGGGEEKSG